MLTTQTIIFYITALIALFSATAVIFSKKITNSIIWAFLTFISVALLFFALEMQYLAAVQILLCSVGMSLLFIFALMLTRKDKENEPSVAVAPRMFFAGAGLIYIAFLIFIFLKYSYIIYPEGLITTNTTIIMPSLKELSTEMFTGYAAPFIFSSILFLSVILGFGVIFSSHKGGKKQQ